MAFTSNKPQQKKQDNRKPNFQPNHLPAMLAVIVRLAGEILGGVTAVQGDKLSEAGNVTYKGGIKDGWMLPGTWMDTLKNLSFEVNGVTLSAAASGVHQSTAGNPTVCNLGTVELPDSREEGKTVKYQVQVYATWLVKKGSYSLGISAFPQGVLTGGPRGPQVIGEVEGLTVLPRDAA